MITVERYDELLAYAKHLTYLTSIDPYDVVHTALAENEDCGPNHVKKAFWQLKDSALRIVEYKEDISNSKRYKTKTKICNRCHDELPLGAFTYLSRGRPQGICDRCICAKANAYKKANPKRSKKNAKEWYKANSDLVKKKVKAWRTANPERVKAIARKSAKKNMAKRLAYKKRWRANNRDKKAAEVGKNTKARKARGWKKSPK